MKFCEITLAGNLIELHGDKLMYIPAFKLLCVSDIHFEKATYFRGFGSLLPPYDTQETLLALENALARFNPELVIALGDSFHDTHAADRLETGIYRRLCNVIRQSHRWIWITGNHDPEIAKKIPGERMDEFYVADITFRHQQQKLHTGAEISGHYHPKATVSLKRSRITSACFVQQNDTLILPAFGTFTGGLNVDDPAFLEIVPQETRKLYMTYEGNVYPIR